MNFISASTAIIFAALLCAANASLSDEPTVLRQCGQTVLSNSGSIEYKLDEFYSSEELCAFTIRTSSVGDLVFTLESHGINGTSDPFAINIFTFGQSGVIETTHLGPPNPLTQTFISGSIAVVVFRTNKGSNKARGTGFKLSFNAVVSNDYYGITGQDYIFTNASNPNGQLITLPFWENPGRNRANVIVLSAEGKAVADVFSSMRLTFLRENLQKHISVGDCGYDAIYIYTFTSERLEHEQTFCSLLHHRAVYVTKGLMILVFRDFEESYWNSHEATFKWEIYKS